MHGTGIFAAQLEDIPHLNPPGYGQGMLSADGADAAFHGLCKIMIQGVRAVTLHTQAGIMAVSYTHLGSVTRANHVVVRFLSQQPVFEPEDTILESVLKGNEKSLPVGRGSDEEKGHGEWELESQAKSCLLYTSRCV